RSASAEFPSTWRGIDIKPGTGPRVHGVSPGQRASSSPAIDRAGVHEAFHARGSVAPGCGRPGIGSHRYRAGSDAEHEPKFDTASNPESVGPERIAGAFDNKRCCFPGAEHPAT